MVKSTRTQPIFIEFGKGMKHTQGRPEKAKTSYDINAFQDAGILIPDDVVVVDIDKVPHANLDRFLSLVGVPDALRFRTPRGYHIWFKKPANFKQRDGICAAGFKVELLTSTNRPGGLTIKRNGQVDPCIGRRAVDIVGLPYFFYTSYKGNNKAQDVTGFGVGDGRNDAMFNIYNVLQYGLETEANTYTVSQNAVTKQSQTPVTAIGNPQAVCRAINECIFAVPLSADELATATRPRNNKPDVDLTLEQNIPQQLETEATKNLKVVRWGDALWYYDKNKKIYCSDSIGIQKHMFQVSKLRFPKMTPKHIDDAVKLCAYDAPTTDSDIFPVRLRNCYLNDGDIIPIDDKVKVNTLEAKDGMTPELSDGDMLKDLDVKTLPSDYFTPYVADVLYNPQADDVPIVDEYLESISGGDINLAQRILEMMAQCLITHPNTTSGIGKFYIIYGTGGNGKGTLLKVIEALLGSINCSHVKPAAFADMGSFPALIGKLANLGDDIDDAPIDSAQFSRIKNVTTADYMDVRKLYSQAHSTRTTATLIFTSNNILTVTEKGNSLQRRLVYVPIQAHYTHPDPDMFLKLTTEKALEYWYKLIIPVYIRMVKTLHANARGTQHKEIFTHSDVIDQFMSEYFEENDPATTWVNDLSTQEVLNFIYKKKPRDVAEAKAHFFPDYKNCSDRQLKSAIRQQLHMVSSVRKIPDTSGHVKACRVYDMLPGYPVPDPYEARGIETEVD